ncbi:iron dicitrate transport regulator FecR [Sphingorhabdus soli]|uniref:Iron dicitrate transport regulator FecR n=1 Tax=Flavisphingopyxis soli TaxID=2601267 RepID=A0A5C6U806_9SPHN|nr:FecR domain-containing protein [Sphingorhabdus soli]TXC69157.1 iron dicitrate transport regulator FecR [Sphingorhabdus soli]
MSDDREIDEIAMTWALQTQDPEFEAWDSFTDWLELDPRHGRAYDEICFSIDRAARLVGAAAPANDDVQESYSPPRRDTRRGVLAMVVAASIGVAVIGLTMWPMSQTDRVLYSFATKPGVVRTVNLPSGSVVQLAGGSTINLDRNDPRFARLDEGRALFSVEHDPDAPFIVEVGDDRLQDIGTVFEIGKTPLGLDLRVSEGAVVLNPAAEAVDVRKGQRLVKKRDTISVRRSLPNDGEWLSGQLTFRDTSLITVAARLSQASGLDFTVDPSARGQRVSGSVAIEPIALHPETLGLLLGVKATKTGGSWRLSLP